MTGINCRYDYDGAVNIEIVDNGLQPDVMFTLDCDDAKALVEAVTRELVLWESGAW